MANEITAADIAATKPDCLAGAGIEEKAETIGVNKANMNTNLKSLVPLSLLAGMFIGMGALFMTYVKADQTLSFAASSVSTVPTAWAPMAFRKLSTLGS